MQLEAAIEKALKNRDVESLHELVSNIKKLSKSKIHPEEIANAINEYLLDKAIIDITINWDTQKVVYRESLFAETLFRIKMTDFEINSKRLVVGHRFIPFINPTINPLDLVFKDEKDGIIEIKESIETMEDVMIFHSLLPPYGYDHYKMNNDETINVFYLDLSTWLVENKFTNKDRILISPIDYENATFLLEKESSRELASQKLIITQKDDALIEAIIDVVNEEEGILPTDITLFKAFAACEPPLVLSPGTAIGPLISQSEELDIYHDVGISYIHEKDFHERMYSNILDETMFPDFDSMGESTDIPGIFAELGNSFTEDFIKGKFIQQMLKTGDTNKEAVMDIIFKEGVERFFNKQQEENFEQALEQLSEETKAEWSNKSMSLPHNNLLNKILAFKIEIISLLREIDAKLVDPADFDFSMLIQLQPFEQLSDQILSGIIEEGAMNPKEAKDLTEQVEIMREKFRDAGGHILNNM